MLRVLEIVFTAWRISSSQQAVIQRHVAGLGNGIYRLADFMLSLSGIYVAYLWRGSAFYRLTLSLLVSGGKIRSLLLKKSRYAKNSTA